MGGRQGGSASAEGLSLNTHDQSWRTHNIGRVLFSASYVFVQDELRTVNAQASVALTQALVALFQNIDAQTTGLTQIAAKAKMTKQAMLELVDKAERLGLVYRRADPADRRAKHVELTSTGLEVVQRLNIAEMAAEARLASIVGDEFVAELRTKLRHYIETVGEDDASDGPPQPPPASQPPADHLGRLLQSARSIYVAEALRAVAEAGFDAVRDVHLALYRNLDLKGAHLTVVAQRAQMTKQAMRELVDQTEALGFVERFPDPADGRAKVIRFTEAGLIMLGHVRDGILQAEATLGQIAGVGFVGEAKRRLGQYVNATDPARLTAIDSG